MWNFNAKATTQKNETRSTKSSQFQNRKDSFHANKIMNTEMKLNLDHERFESI